MFDTTFGFSILALLLAVQGIAIAAFVLFRSRQGTQNLRGALAAVGLVWIVPAAAGLGYITLQAAPHFQPPGSDWAAVEQEQKRIQAERAAIDAEQMTIVSAASGAKIVVRKRAGSEAEHALADPQSTDSHFLVRTEDGESVPAWVTIEADLVVDGDRVLRHVQSQQYATVEEAEAEALREAAQIASRDLHEYQAYTVGWNVPKELVRNHAIRGRHIEKIERDFGQFTAQMYRAHMQVELSPETRQNFQPAWKEQLVQRRLTVMGSVVGLLTVILIAAASYLRLDAATHGAHRRGLQWAAASLVAAGTVAAGVVIQTV